MKHPSLNLARKIFSILLFSIFYLALPGCGDDDTEKSLDGNPNSGLAPSSLKGTTLVFTSSSGSQLMSISHLSESGLIMNDKTIDYAKYPPSYSYTRRGSNTAGYKVNITRMTYIPYSGSIHYSPYSYDLNLTFIAGGRHLYNGTQTNAQGATSRISGTFTIGTE